MYENGFADVIHLPEWDMKVNREKNILFGSSDSLNTSFFFLLYLFRLTFCSFFHSFLLRVPSRNV